MSMSMKLVIVGLSVAYGTMAHATETITYTYDAKGRVVQAVHTGTVNNGITTTYTHDNADNRTEVKTAGASH